MASNDHNSESQNGQRTVQNQNMPNRRLKVVVCDDTTMIRRVFHLRLEDVIIYANGMLDRRNWGRCAGYRVLSGVPIAAFAIIARWITSGLIDDVDQLATGTEEQADDIYVAAYVIAHLFSLDMAKARICALLMLYWDERRGQCSERAMERLRSSSSVLGAGDLLLVQSSHPVHHVGSTGLTTVQAALRSPLVMTTNDDGSVEVQIDFFWH